MPLSALTMQTLGVLYQNGPQTGSTADYEALIEAGYVEALPDSRYKLTKQGTAAAKAAAEPRVTWILGADCSEGLLMDLVRQASGESLNVGGGEGYLSGVSAVGPTVPDWMRRVVEMLKDRGIAHDLHSRR